MLSALASNRRLSLEFTGSNRDSRLSVLHVATLLTFFVSHSAVATAAVASAPPLKVLAVGDSLTAVRYYREHFITAALKDDQSIRMVGPHEDASPEFAYRNQPLLNRHAGFSGLRIEALNDAGDTGLKALMSVYAPDVVLLQIGTNNMGHGLGATMPEASHYPHDGRQALGPEWRPAINGSHLDGLGSRWGDASYGTRHLREQLQLAVDAVLKSSAAPEAKLVLAKIPPVGSGNPAFNPSPDGKRHHENADQRIREYNGYIDRCCRELPRSLQSRVVVVDNYRDVNRDYGDPGQGFDFGPASAQSQDWVHPQPNANAWRRFAEHFYAGFQRLSEKTRVSD